MVKRKVVGDFEKKKTKLGKSQISSNSTETSVKIRRVYLPEQTISNINHQSQSSLNKSNDSSLHEILIKVGHHSHHARREALLALRRFVLSNPQLSNLRSACSAALVTILDDSEAVRNASVSILLLHQMIPALYASKSLLNARIGAGLAHISRSIRLSTCRLIQSSSIAQLCDISSLTNQIQALFLDSTLTATSRILVLDATLALLAFSVSENSHFLRVQLSHAIIAHLSDSEGESASVQDENHMKPGWFYRSEQEFTGFRSENAFVGSRIKDFSKLNELLKGIVRWLEESGSIQELLYSGNELGKSIVSKKSNDSSKLHGGFQQDTNKNEHISNAFSILHKSALCMLCLRAVFEVNGALKLWNTQNQKINSYMKTILYESRPARSQLHALNASQQRQWDSMCDVAAVILIFDDNIELQKVALEYYSHRLNTDKQKELSARAFLIASHALFYVTKGETFQLMRAIEYQSVCERWIQAWSSPILSNSAGYSICIKLLQVLVAETMKNSDHIDNNRDSTQLIISKTLPRILYEQIRISNNSQHAEQLGILLQKLAVILLKSGNSKALRVLTLQMRPFMINNGEPLSHTSHALSNRILSVFYYCPISILIQLPKLLVLVPSCIRNSSAVISSSMVDILSSIVESLCEEFNFIELEKSEVFIGMLCASLKLISLRMKKESDSELKSSALRLKESMKKLLGSDPILLIMENSNIS